MKETASLNKEFASRELNDTGQLKVAAVRNSFNQLLNTLVGPTDYGRVERLVPEGRELSIVKTKLEEACMFAIKGIANDPANQK